MITMSAFGPKQTKPSALHMSAFGGKADIEPSFLQSGQSRCRDVRLRPRADIKPVSAISVCKILWPTIGRTERVPFRKVVWSVTRRNLRKKRLVPPGPSYCRDGYVLRLLAFVKLFK
jgi:hypothetical protein